MNDMNTNTKDQTPESATGSGPDCAESIGSAIRQLMLAVEFMRAACEHSEGKTATDRERLSLAMSVGIRLNAMHAGLLADYKRESFWADVWTLPEALGLPNAGAQATKPATDQTTK